MQAYTALYKGHILFINQVIFWDCLFLKFLLHYNYYEEELSVWEEKILLIVDG